ncbi:hypothetical protein M3X96_10500, partial [Pasteurella multocida]|nr:hypothetical protein [Pasteurella multocida]
MKVYFLKKNLNQYQTFPIPEDLNEFIEIEIDNETELEVKQLINYRNNYILVSRCPSDNHVWNGKEWVIS